MIKETTIGSSEEPKNLYSHLYQERSDSFNDVYKTFKNDPEILDHLNKQAERSNKVTEEMKRFTIEKNGIIISFNHISTGGWDKNNRPDIGVRIERLSALKEMEEESEKTGDGIELLFPDDSAVGNIGYEAWEKFINNPDAVNIQNHKEYKTMYEIIELLGNLSPVERK